jgi:hypothetical protein
MKCICTKSPPLHSSSISNYPVSSIQRRLLSISKFITAKYKFSPPCPRIRSLEHSMLRVLTTSPDTTNTARRVTVFVTIAYLLDTAANELISRMGHCQPSNKSRGIRVQDVFNMLAETRVTISMTYTCSVI